MIVRPQSDQSPTDQWATLQVERSTRFFRHQQPEFLLGISVLAQIVLEQTGRYFVITGSGEGDATQLQGSGKVAAPKRLKGKLEDYPRGEQLELTFGALPGARLTLKAKVSKKSDLDVRVVALVDPDGEIVPIDGDVTTKGTSLTLQKDLAKVAQI